MKAAAPDFPGLVRPRRREGDGIGDAVRKGPDCCRGRPVQHHLVRPAAQRAGRRPVGSGEREQGGLLPGRGQGDIGVQGME
jgi:hypothetical protein